MLTTDSNKAAVEARIKLYEDIFKEWISASNWTYKPSGFCFFFQIVYNINVYSDENFKKRFPELYELKPRGTSFWFAPRDMDSRKRLLAEVIINLQNQLT